MTQVTSFGKAETLLIFPMQAECVANAIIAQFAEYSLMSSSRVGCDQAFTKVCAGGCEPPRVWRTSISIAVSMVSDVMMAAFRMPASSKGLAWLSTPTPQYGRLSHFAR